MKRSPVLTIITPNYNSGDKLLATVRSTVSESVEFEHIIVDGASTDGSTELASELAAEHAHLKVYSEVDNGVYDAMNKGIQHARGRYLFFLGAGDLLIPGGLTRISQHLPECEHALIYGDVLYRGISHNGKFSRLMLCEGNICHQCILYSRRLFNLVGMYNTRYKALADWEFNLRCFGNRHVQVQYVPVIVAHFEVGGISSAGDKDFERDRTILLSQHLGLGIYLLHKLIVLKRGLVAAFGLTNSRHRLIAVLQSLHRKIASWLLSQRKAKP